MVVTISCFNCKQTFERELPISRSDSCANCRADVRACKNCQFFDGSSRSSCHEDRAEWVQDQEKANFCSYFMGNTKSANLGQPQTNHRRNLDNLFAKNDEFCMNDQPSSSTSLEQQIKDFLSKKK